MSQSGDTQTRLLRAACQVFAQQGYEKATVQEICKEADANVAAVNYYFRSKRQLYIAVWERLYSLAMQVFEDPELSTRTPRERLIELIRRRVAQLFATDAPALCRMVIHREMSNPSDAHEEIIQRFVSPGVGRLIALVGEVLGPDADTATVAQCAFSIHAHMVSLSISRLPGNDMGTVFGTGLSDATCEALTTHAVTFLMAGIDAAAARKDTP